MHTSSQKLLRMQRIYINTSEYFQFACLMSYEEKNKFKLLSRLNVWKCRLDYTKGCQ